MDNNFTAHIGGNAPDGEPTVFHPTRKELLEILKMYLQAP